MQCLVEGISHAGEGVARIAGKATFIPYAIPGETVAVTIIEEKKSYQRALLQQVIHPSQDRCQPNCRHYFTCGGCSFQHVDYPRQLTLKRQIVEETLRRVGGIEIPVSPVIGMETPWHYRNKVEWHLSSQSGREMFGYFMNQSHEMVDIENCPLISQAIQAVSLYIKNHRKILRVPDKCEITVRQSSLSQIMIIFSGNQTSQIDFALLADHCKEISFYSIDQNITRLHYGETRLEEKLGEFKFEISPLAFFQVNHQQNEKMLAVIKDYARLQRSDSVLDAYCGTGSIALSLARDVKRVVGVENFKAAIKDAKRNAFLNNITNTQFIKGACEEIVPALTDDFDVIILDPPRSGCKKELIQEVINKSPRSLIYVSCNPATLARDLALFEDSVYQVKEIQPIDMFPQTSHVECVVRIYRKEKTVRDENITAEVD